MKFKWFKNCDCIEEVKAQYRKLAMAHHPDKGGAECDMKEINLEYEELFKCLKDTHRSTREGGPATYQAETPTAETPEDFINIVDQLFRLDGLTVELCGRWLWISGETLRHKESLRKMGCKWSRGKQKWSWHFPEDSAMSYKGKKPWSMERIRLQFGSDELKPGERGAVKAIGA